MSKILEKADKLKKSGFELGATIDKNDKEAGSGGLYRRFENATIYWHKVMREEAHVLHGKILEKYLEMGGPGANPKTGKRDLGFPLSDVKPARVSHFNISYFEWGAILTNDLVISGDFYEAWKGIGADAGALGCPLTEVFNAAGGKVILFEYGCLWKGSYSKNKVTKIFFNFPKIGNPAFVSKDNPQDFSEEVSVRLDVGMGLQNIDYPRSFFDNLFRGILYMAPTGKPNVPLIALNFPENNVKSVTTLSLIGYSSLNPDEIFENTLYDIVIKVPLGKTICLAPHAVYFRNSWKNFGAIHVTDIHISNRLDGFRDKLHELGLKEGARQLNNYNDNFRDFIRYANRLHDAGQLDVIIATGDLVDYEFEYLAYKDDELEYLFNLKDDKQRFWLPTNLNNFAYLEKIIRGRIPYPDGKPSEELRVPILTTLGNHDYRGYRYMLNFEIDIEVTKKIVQNFPPINLTEYEANALQGSPKRKSYAKETAINMSRVDTQVEYYKKRFSEKSSFLVKLGNHQILMLDTYWDKDMIDSIGDAALNWLGFDSESSRNFADGNPDSQGMNDSQISMLRSTLKKPEGLVIVGMHAPPINPKSNEYPHYFRETEHSKLKISFDFDNKAKDDISAFLWRNDRQGGISANDYIYKHKGWFEIQGETCFYRGKTINDLLDYGTAKDKVNELLQLCSGKGVARKANLILSGHIHKRAEFRVQWDSKKGEFLVYFDFYTENPRFYYPSKKIGFDEPVHIEVKSSAPLPDQTTPRTITKPSLWGDYQVLQIPPYAHTLKNATDKAGWWKEHSPLVIQTAALGPTEANQRLQVKKDEDRPNPGPSFQGCRLIRVKNDTISEIRYIGLFDIRKIHYLEPVLSIMMH